MSRSFAAASLVVGVILLMFGLNAMDSLSSMVSSLFTGAPTDRSIWLVALGLFGILLALFALLRRRPS